MYNCQLTQSIMRRNILYVILLQAILLSIGSASSSAQEATMKTFGTPVEVASLGETSQKPMLDSARDIDGALDRDVLEAKNCNERGVAYSEKGQYDLALSEFNKALDIAPMSAETYNNRGITYSKKGQYDLAVADFTKSLDIDPNASKVLYNRGITYAIRGQFDLALLDLNRSLQIQSGSAAVYDIRGSLHAELACSDWKQACNFGNCEHLREAKKAGLCTETNETGASLQ